MDAQNSSLYLNGKHKQNLLLQAIRHSVQAGWI